MSSKWGESEDSLGIGFLLTVKRRRTALAVARLTRGYDIVSHVPTFRMTTNREAIDLDLFDRESPAAVMTGHRLAVAEFLHEPGPSASPTLGAPSKVSTRGGHR